MIRILSSSLLLLLVLSCPAVAGSLSVAAQDIYMDLAQQDFQLEYARTVEKKGNYHSQISYLSEYMFVLISIQNDTGAPIAINPNYFTLVSDQKRSYSYSKETYGLERRIPWMKTPPIDNVKLMPGTESVGFLMFEKTRDEENPVTLYFDNGGVTVQTQIIVPKAE